MFKNVIQQYRMVKGRVAPPKCLFRVATQTKKDQYTLTEQSAHLVLLTFGIHLLTPHSYTSSS